MLNLCLVEPQPPCAGKVAGRAWIRLTRLRDQHHLVQPTVMANCSSASDIMPSECVAWQAVISAVGLADANDCMDMLLDPCGCFRVVCANGHITELNMNA